MSLFHKRKTCHTIASLQNLCSTSTWLHSRQTHKRTWTRSNQTLASAPQAHYACLFLHVCILMLQQCSCVQKVYKWDSHNDTTPENCSCLWQHVYTIGHGHLVLHVKMADPRMTAIWFPIISITDNTNTSPCKQEELSSLNWSLLRAHNCGYRIKQEHRVSLLPAKIITHYQALSVHSY